MVSVTPDGSLRDCGLSPRTRLEGGSGARRSGGPEGERVEVVGEDRPGGPGAGAGVAFEAGSVEGVASLEGADAAFGADAELGQPAGGLAGGGGGGGAGGQAGGGGEGVGGGAGGGD